MATQIGCTGWSFPDWYKNGFYSRKEKGLAKQKSDMNYQLNRYSHFFSCTEVNSFNYTITVIDPKELESFGVPSKALWWYKKQLEHYPSKDDPWSPFERIKAIVSKWDRSTPPDFVFSAKVPGMITHAKCLRECGHETRLFLDAMQNVKKIKYLLFEFPSYFTREKSFEHFQEYFSKVKSDFTYVVEFRSADWQDVEVANFCKDHNITIALSEVTDKGVVSKRQSDSNFAYIRIIGKHSIIETFDKMQLTDDRISTLNHWAKQIENIENSIVFVNNNFAGNAPQTANYLKSLLGQRPKEWRNDLSRFFT